MGFVSDEKFKQLALATSKIVDSLARLDTQATVADALLQAIIATHPRPQDVRAHWLAASAQATASEELQRLATDAPDVRQQVRQQAVEHWDRILQDAIRAQGR